jgi:SAM-dependent methyltransferase
LHAIDPAPDALAVARANLDRITNVRFHLASASELPFADGTLDFAYSLGVLHHVPDTLEAIRNIAAKLKPGAPFLVYLYYAFDNRGALYRALWHVSNAVRLIFSRLPFGVQRVGTFCAAALVYWPLARGGAALDAIGAMPRSWPLQFYRRRTFYVMRTDAFDRFCTRLEQRFTRPQIADMLRCAGFGDIKFTEKEPFWVALATKL